jgi:segregation and condensation protein B
MSERFQQLRLLEALLFAAAEPLSPEQLARHFPEQADLESLLEELGGLYANRGVTLVRAGQRWAFRTAADLAPSMRVEKTVQRKLSRAAVETLAIIAYHQPVTRGEIEEVRGVALSRGTLDVLLEAGWVKPKGRRRTPGRPVTWGTTDAFLDHFGLEDLDALPGAGELKAAGLLDTRPAIAALGALGTLEEGAPAAGEEADTAEVQEEDPWDILSAEFDEAPEGQTSGASSDDEAADHLAGSNPGDAAGSRPARGDES